jgi:hypothetical protein
MIPAPSSLGGQQLLTLRECCSRPGDRREAGTRHEEGSDKAFDQLGRRAEFRAANIHSQSLTTHNVLTAPSGPRVRSRAATKETLAEIAPATARCGPCRRQNSIKPIESFIAAAKTIGIVCHSTGALHHVKTPDGKPLVEGKEVPENTPMRFVRIRLTTI